MANSMPAGVGRESPAKRNITKSQPKDIAPTMPRLTSRRTGTPGTLDWRAAQDAQRDSDGSPGNYRHETLLADQASSKYLPDLTMRLDGTPFQGG